MAKEYFEKLSNLPKEANVENEVSQSIEVKHFLVVPHYTQITQYVHLGHLLVQHLNYQNKKFKKLIKNGEAKPLKYFPKGHVNKVYALIGSPNNKKPKQWKKYFITPAKQV